MFTKNLFNISKIIAFINVLFIISIFLFCSEEKYPKEVKLWANGKVVAKKIIYKDKATKIIGNIPDGQVTEYWPSFFKIKRIRAIFEYKNGKRNGKATVWDKKGNKILDGFFKDDKIHGKHINYYDDGKKFRVYYYDKGTQVGKDITFHHNGKKAIEEYYVNDKLSGKFIVYYPNGNKKYESSYHEGVEDGKITMWYSNGIKSTEGYFEKGYPCSTWTSWYQNGIKEKESMIQKDTIINHNCWDKKGNLIECKDIKKELKSLKELIRKASK